VPGTTSPTVRRRELGVLLRSMRTAKGLTVDQVAERLMCSASKVSRMETGQRGATLRDIRDLCDIYGVTDPSQREHLMDLAKEGKQQGWWQSYDLPFSTYIGLEADAISIKDYDSAIVPGLLQTAEYARAVHEVVLPELEPEKINQGVEVRLKRQRLLTQEPPLHYWAVLDEAVLHRLVGGTSVMGAQLERLIEASKLPNITMQVIPYSAGAHPALDSTFKILDFAEPVPSVVYVEGLVGWIYVERPQDVGRYRQVFERLCDIALTPQESIELVASVKAGFRSL
jgi:transcriptional regulator with XRE-family HTH domain